MECAKENSGGVVEKRVRRRWPREGGKDGAKANLRKILLITKNKKIEK